MADDVAARRRSARREHNGVKQKLPLGGVLVPLAPSEMTADRAANIAKALQREMSPIALSYRQVTDREASALTTVRLNSSTQQALTQILSGFSSNRPTLYKAVLPQGATLAKAAGGGFRGLAQAANGRITAQAVLVPAGAGAAAAAAWPLLAVGATTLLLDQAGAAEQRKTLRRIEEHLQRADLREQRTRHARITVLDRELRHTIAAMLDGRPVDGTWEQVRRDAFIELHVAEQFARDSRRAAHRVIHGSRADFKQLSNALDGALTQSGRFYADLEHARSALLLSHRAAVATAAAAALADPANPYTALRPVLEEHFAAVRKASDEVQALTDSMSRITLTTKHMPWDRGEERRMQRLLRRELGRPLLPTAPKPVQFLAMPDGQMHQVLPQSP